MSNTARITDYTRKKATSEPFTSDCSSPARPAAPRHPSKFKELKNTSRRENLYVLEPFWEKNKIRDCLKLATV